MHKAKLDVERVVPGMELAEPITNEAGIVLIPPGIRLTPMFIARLKKWNVRSVHVVDGPSREEEEREDPGAAGKRTEAAPHGGDLSREQEAFARAVAEEADRRFANVRNNPLMMRLRAVAVKKLTAHGRKGMVNVIRLGVRADTEGEN